MTNNIIHLEYMPLDELVRAGRNPKDHDLGTIHESIERFGFVNPMLINERTGRVVAGHGRIDALQRMKASGERPPGRIIVKDKRWLVPVIRGVSFDTDEEAEAYLIADNRTVEVGGWSETELTQMLADLAAKGEEMLRGIGFDMDDLDDMLKRDAPKSSTETNENIAEQWSVLIECADELEQTQLLEELTERGLKVRALTA